jgi:hypothetical protein
VISVTVDNDRLQKTWSADPAAYKLGASPSLQKKRIDHAVQLV